MNEERGDLVSRLAKNILKGCCVFVGSFLLIHIVASSFYEVDADGYLQAPNSYPIIIMLVSASITFLSFKMAHGKKSKKSGNFINHIRHKKQLDAMTDIERWELDRQARSTTSDRSSGSTAIEVDTLIDQAASVIFETGQASVSMLQRKMDLGYAAAAHIMDRLEAAGVVSEFSGNTPREILVSRSEYESRKRIIPRDNSVFGAETDQSSAYSDGFARYGGVDAVLLSIDLMEGHDFEYWCAALLRKLDFQNVRVTPGSGDQGVDILAEKDGIRYAIQCKCYSSNLGNTPVQEVHSGKDFYHCQIGVVMTNRYFTQGAKNLAAATGTLLWDRDWISARISKTQKS